MNQRLEKAKKEHEAWLLKNGAHRSQIATRKTFSNKPKDFGVAKTYYANLSNTIAPPVLDNSIWEKIRLGNESSKTISEIHAKRARVGPAFNKGGLQLLSGKDEIKAAGRKYVDD